MNQDKKNTQTMEVTGIEKAIKNRDMKQVEILAGELEHLSADMFQMDLSNQLNRDFVNQILDQYSKKFDVTDAKEYTALFKLACDSGNDKICSTLLKQKAEQEQYVMLAGAQGEAFKLLCKTKSSGLDTDTIVSVLFAAALTRDAESRLDQLAEAGYAITTENSQKKTVMNLLEERINNKSYPVGKKGIQMKTIDQNTLLHLKYMPEKTVTKEKKNKTLIGCIAGGVAVLAVIVAVAFWYVNRDNQDSTDVGSTSMSSASTDTVASSDSTGSSSENSEAGSSSGTSSSSESTTLNTDTALTVADGDTVNIDYTGYVDGVAFDGGSTDGAGADLTIGSGLYIDDFEEQLIGSNVGDQVEVNVTFPEDYGKEDLNGKDATFDVTINGIYK